MLPNSGVSQFAQAAREFCAWVELVGGSVVSEEQTSLELRRLIANLYLLALSLPPDWNDEWASISDERRVTIEERNSLLPRLRALPFSFYNVFFEPATLEETSVIGDLTDDVLDIYCDLKEGLGLFERGFKGLACWKWRFSFHAHWAQHATDALHAMQAHAPRDA
jgi:Domain of unknown function (DUF5063)